MNLWLFKIEFLFDYTMQVLVPTAQVILQNFILEMLIW